jgi:threonyl-tRNA synthetase
MSDEKLNKARHSLAHIMAAAVQKLWPEAKFGVGPVIENGFYYDIDIPGVTISVDDFGKIEDEMRKISNASQDFVRTEKHINEAIEWSKQTKQPYKEELLNDLKRSGTTSVKDIDSAELGIPSEDSAVESVSFYQNGDFLDLCRGPHVENTSEIPADAFKLTKVAGAYWRGNENNPQMQRLYGVAFENKDELQKYLNQIEEAKKRDHRKLGQELDLFVVSELVGSGLPLFTPRGTVLREELSRYSNELRQSIGFEKVWIPHITKTALYEKSGHWDKFGDELFLVESQETSDKFVMKPMNCPHHTRIYAAKPRSYRDLPVRYLETTTVYRDEKTGELGGLSRVRSITQDDSHVFCRHDQIGQEINSLLAAAYELYQKVDMKLRVRLSYRDDNGIYLGEEKLWESAQEQLKSAVEANNLEYFEERGEAAFYGPKIDFMATDALGREHQVATVQLDFVQPARFELEYTAEDGSKQQPVMIHSALLGSIERFLSVYIEHTAGKFPIWLAPEQLRLIQVKDSSELDAFVDKIAAIAKENGIRITIDRTNETVGKKIRAAEVMKVPYTVVVGDKELDTEQMTPRIRSDLEIEGRKDTSYPYENLIRSIANEIKGRVQKSSL